MSVFGAFRGPWSRCLVVAVAVVLSTACSKSVSEARQASAALVAGLKAHAAGRLEEAEAHYRSLLVYDPGNKFAYYSAGPQASGSTTSPP